MSRNIFDMTAKRGDGTEAKLEDFRGKSILIVNTASHCGFTPQYKGLEELHNEYKDRGLVVLGFPCDQFGHQEPGTDEEIQNFCERNFGVSFPLMSKIEVNGPSAHPVFEFLKDQAPGIIGKSIKWNFTKFLVHQDGQTVKRFAPNTEPQALKKDIELSLGLVTV